MNTQSTNWRLIFLLWLLGLLAAAQFGKITLTLTGLAATYPGAPVAFAVSAVAVVGILAGPVAGFLVAQIGARRAVLAAVIGSALMSGVQGLDLPFGLFMASRVIEGLGHLFLVVALPTIMAALAKPADKSVVMGLWGTFFGVSYAILAMVTPAIESWGGIRALYLGHGMLLTAMVPVLLGKLPVIIPQRQKMPGLWALYRMIYSAPRSFAPGLGHGLYASLFIALVAFLPAHMGHAGLVALLPVANLLGTFGAGFMGKYIAPSRLSPLGFLITALLFILLGLFPSPIIALVAFFSTGVVAGANFAAVPELNDGPERQARANGAMAQMGNLGTFSGTPLFALVATSLWQIVGLAVLICAFGLIGAGLAYRAARTSVVDAG